MAARLGANGPGADGGSEINDTDRAAAAACRASVDDGKPLSERKLAAMFGKTSRRLARHRMAEARESELEVTEAASAP